MSMRAKANMPALKNQVRVFFRFHKIDENKKIFLFLLEQKPIDFQCLACSPMGRELIRRTEARNFREKRILAH